MTLPFAAAVVPAQIKIWQNIDPRSLVKVEARLGAGAWSEVLSRGVSDALTTGASCTTSVVPHVLTSSNSTMPTTEVDQIRLTVNQSDFAAYAGETDAVQLVVIEPAPYVPPAPETTVPAPSTTAVPVVAPNQPGFSPAAVTPAQIAQLTPAQISTFRPEQVRQLPPAAVAALAPAQIVAIPPRAIDVMRPVQIASVPPATFVAMTVEQIATFSRAQARAVTPEQTRLLSRAQIRAAAPEVRSILRNLLRR